VRGHYPKLAVSTIFEWVLIQKHVVATDLLFMPERKKVGDCEKYPPRIVRIGFKISNWYLGYFSWFHKAPHS